jgi:hypothetical protein
MPCDHHFTFCISYPESNQIFFLQRASLYWLVEIQEEVIKYCSYILLILISYIITALPYILSDDFGPLILCSRFVLCSELLCNLNSTFLPCCQTFAWKDRNLPFPWKLHVCRSPLARIALGLAHLTLGQFYPSRLFLKEDAFFKQVRPKNMHR